MTEPGTDTFDDAAARTPVRPVAVTAVDADVVTSRTVLAIYDAHHRELATFARAIERDAAAADDIVSEAFVKLIEEIRRGRPPDQPRAWLHRVVANLVIDAGRRRHVLSRIVGRLVDRETAEPADAPILGAEDQRELRDALALLPVDARTALMLAAHGFSGREVAEALGRTELAARSLLWRARTSMRDHLRAREDLR